MLRALDGKYLFCARVGRLQRSLFALGLNALRKAMVKMSELEIFDYMTALFKPNIPRKPLIGPVL